MESMRKATASAGMAGKDLSVMFQKNNASTQRALATAPASWESVSVFPDTKEKYVKKVRASFQYLASGYSLAGLSTVSFCRLVERHALFFANIRCSTCPWNTQQRFEVREAQVSSGSLTEYMRLFL